jgi:hypothetical protein
MSLKTLYGASKNSGDKKLKRATVSLVPHTYDLIAEIADAKGITVAEVINLLVEQGVGFILEQEKLIKTSPIAVAFDLATKD